MFVLLIDENKLLLLSKLKHFFKLLKPLPAWIFTFLFMYYHYGIVLTKKNISAACKHNVEFTIISQLGHSDMIYDDFKFYHKIVIIVYKLL